jgi:hypothetical protein
MAANSSFAFFNTESAPFCRSSAAFSKLDVSAEAGGPSARDNSADGKRKQAIVQNNNRGGRILIAIDKTQARSQSQLRAAR